MSIGLLAYICVCLENVSREHNKTGALGYFVIDFSRVSLQSVLILECFYIHYVPGTAFT